MSGDKDHFVVTNDTPDMAGLRHSNTFEQDKLRDRDASLTRAVVTAEEFARADAPCSLPTLTSSEPQHEKQFQLMKLSPELRLNVYDFLFTDLTINRQREVADLSMYHHHHEWPGNDFTAYRNLLLTCKGVHEEARDLWEKKYACQCCFYFWSAHNLFRVAMLLTKLGEPYQHMNYALRTRTHNELERNRGIRIVKGATVGLMAAQPGFPHHSYAHFIWWWPRLRSKDEEVVETSSKYRHILCTFRQSKDVLGIFGRADFLSLQECSIAEHNLRTQPKKYLLMSGKIAGIYWDEYDADQARTI